MPPVGARRRPERRFIAAIGIAAIHLCAGAAVFVLAPFIGTTRVPDYVFRLVLLMWAVGFIVLPALSFSTAKRAVFGAVVVVAVFLIIAALVSGGLRSPYGY
jgi:hypothetical protein